MKVSAGFLCNPLTFNKGGYTGGWWWCYQLSCNGSRKSALIKHIIQGAHAAAFCQHFKFISLLDIVSFFLSELAYKIHPAPVRVLPVVADIPPVVSLESGVWTLA